MADTNQAAEPTMEEILASIRRIISDDENIEAGPDSDQAAAGDDGKTTPEIREPAVEQDTTRNDDDDLDVLELTDLADHEEPARSKTEPIGMAAEDRDELEGLDAAVQETASLAQAPAAPVDMLSDVTDITDDDSDTPPEPSPPPPAPSQPPAQAPFANQASALLGADASDATMAAFNLLAQSLMSRDGTSRTLEDLVQEMLRPILKNWLDENLPTVVERLVREEIERVSRGRR
jgi:cell pole-organizing protein PopZ